LAAVAFATGRPFGCQPRFLVSFGASAIASTTNG
jgi:hypothetical protein